MALRQPSETDIMQFVAILLRVRPNAKSPSLAGSQKPKKARTTTATPPNEISETPKRQFVKGERKQVRYV